MSDLSDDEGGLGLGELMPRSPSPEPVPFSYATYELPDGFRLSTGDNEVKIRLVGSHPLWGHHLWNTARVTTTYILQHADLCRSKRVLELGAGGALPSLACGMAGASTVVATDYADAALMDNIRHNVDTNLGEGEVGSHVFALGHTWGQDVTPLLEAGKDGYTPSEGPRGVPGGRDGRFDLVILSDLVFNHSQHGALVKTLEETLSLAPADEKKGPCGLVFITHHRPHLAHADMAFLDTLREAGFDNARVVEEWTGPMFDNDPGDERVRGTVHGFRVWRRQEKEEEHGDEEKEEQDGDEKKSGQ